MPSYIGFIHCPTCGVKHLTDPKSVTVWYSADSTQQLSEATCPNCFAVIESKISFDTMVAFKQYDVCIRQLSDRYPKLTEELINDWDVEEELRTYDFNK